MTKTLNDAIEEVKKEKNRVVKSQKYEEAAQLRDKEKKLIEQLDLAKARWEEARLAERFPDYPEYARRTGRFIPRWR